MDIMVRWTAAVAVAVSERIRPWFVPYPVCDVPWDNQVHRCQQQRTSGIVHLPESRLLMPVCLGRNHQALLASSDQGRNWTPLETNLWPGYGTKIMLRPEGMLLGLHVREGELVRTESADGGRTWSDPQPCAMGAFVPPEAEPEMTLNPPGGFTQLRDGTLLAFCVGSFLAPGHAKKHNVWEWGTHPCAAYSIRSTDGGRTWTSPVPLNGQPALGQKWDLCECTSTTQTREGAVLALVRPIYSPWMWEIWSTNGGETWGPATSGPFPCYAATAITTTSGVILVSGRMPSLGLYASHDDGMTWQAYRIDTAGLWAMGHMVEVEPDVVLYAYMDTYESFMRAQYLRVTDDRIEPALDMLPS